jgi:hypothetical protein
MSAKSIFEADGKAILNYHLTRAPVIKPTPLPASATHNAPSKLASLHFAADEDVKGVLDQAEATYPWLLVPGSKFVAKPDQLIKRRGKSGLLALNKTWAEAREWIETKAGKEQRVETVDGVLRQFLVEPFVPHPQETEYYININSVREVRSFHLFPSSFLQVISSEYIRWRVRKRAKCIFGCTWAQTGAQVGAEREVGSNTRERSLVLFDSRPDEGNDARPTSAKHLLFCDTHVHFHMPNSLIFSVSSRCPCVVKSPALVLRLFLSCAYRSARSCQSFADLTANSSA